MDHNPMTMIVYGYNLARNIYMENTDWSEWVPTYLCDNTRRYYLKESVPEIIYLIVIWEIMFVLLFYTQTVFAGVSSDVTGYDYSIVKILDHTCTR